MSFLYKVISSKMTNNLQNYNYCTVNKVIINFVSLYPCFLIYHPFQHLGRAAIASYPGRDNYRSGSTY